LPYIKTENGKQKLDDYGAVIKKQFPWYFDEIKGISDGCELEFDSVLEIRKTKKKFKITKFLIFFRF